MLFAILFPTLGILIGLLFIVHPETVLSWEGRCRRKRASRYDDYWIYKLENRTDDTLPEGTTWYQRWWYLPEKSRIELCFMRIMGLCFLLVGTWMILPV
jgi:hypothetical protein